MSERFVAPSGRVLEGKHAEEICDGIALIYEIRRATGYSTWDYEPAPEELIWAMNYLQNKKAK